MRRIPKAKPKVYWKFLKKKVAEERQVELENEPSRRREVADNRVEIFVWQ
jgi:hypothetical protein